jgi:hypothetical protein
LFQVFNDEIAEKWKAEAMANPDVDVTQKMADWVVAELRYKAKLFRDSGAVPVYAGDVVKSDSAVSIHLKAALQDAVRELEDIREVYKDYHPGSDQKVLDLVHPSLFPLIYGRTRVLSDHIISLEECVKSCGKGAVIPVRRTDETGLDSKGSLYHRHNVMPSPYSTKFQWLPGDIAIEETGRAKYETRTP